uniref:Uncharacterized protein n=1 Tax=Tanacetum cinerariifolium TaxID=118510 RepID=A0A699ICS2_TANCI|nr:hypothetical protein [Tanacetum cinerariifolium]
MTKVIEGEFEKLKDLKFEDVSLTCDISLKVFNNEFSQISRMDDDLFTYEVEFANIPCDSNKDDDSEQRMSHEADDDMGYDPSDVAFTEWLRIDTNIFNFEMPMCKAFNEFNYLLQIDPDLLIKDIMRFKTYKDYKDDWIYEWNENVQWVYDKPWLDNGIWMEPKPVKHTCKPFNYKTECSKCPICSWREDGYCTRGNFLGAYHIRNSIHYQDLKWYEALEDSELKERALRNKAIMEGLISDDESRNDG